MLETKVNLKASLKEFFGFEEFKHNQEQIIENIYNGNDTFVIMPTGGGKSLCYQLPALMLSGCAIIVSPLIALMKDQVDSIRGHSQQNEIAHYLNSSLNKGQIKQVKQDIIDGKTKLVFVAPETLTKEENIEFLGSVNISFVAVDEAHCISEWGHDFRPEYRRIKTMIKGIGDNIPVIALTATATPKVQLDIVKNLNMKNETKYVTSFNRDNLFYEVRPKINKDATIRSIVQIVRTMPNKSGIVYVQSRKATEEIAKVLNVNGIKAAPYHAGLDTKTRNKMQDDFLMEEVDVIVATIAFGMGIDKPDVRFVIHYDIPKSIENYYQETGRAGRDGLEGRCIAFYSYKDILRLEKFLRDKPAAERQLGSQLIEEVIAFSETSSCRRKFLLHYFGEEYNDDLCNKKCDNCQNPAEKISVIKEMTLALEVVEALKGKLMIRPLIDFIVGKKTKEMSDFKYDRNPLFGKGSEKDELFWHSIFRQGILHKLLEKEIEEYGLIKLTEKGKAYMEKPREAMIPLNRDYSNTMDMEVLSGDAGKESVMDEALMEILINLRKSESKRLGVQPWVLFQEPSLIDMATFYPTNMDELTNISGVSRGKAARYGKPFLIAITEYVEENDIEKVTDFVIKQVANKSKLKVAIIQGIDRKLPLEDIAETAKMDFDGLMEEMNNIVDSGTKLNIDYYLEDNMDDEVAEEIYDYFSEAESESVDDAEEELADDDITRQEIQMIRIKFLTEMAN